jgi:hypothetical protein
VRGPVIFAASLLVLAPAPAAAFCSYHGEMYAETTLDQEFRDARWVVRGRVLSGQTSRTEGETWTLYRLDVVESLKGDLAGQFTFFTERNSGGFYMDDGMSGPDVGRTYLLFLIPDPRAQTRPREAAGALWVNYPCGQSRRWDELTPTEVTRLRALAVNQG